jgi:thymidine phosphorylase
MKRMRVIGQNNNQAQLLQALTELVPKVEEIIPLAKHALELYEQSKYSESGYKTYEDEVDADNAWDLFRQFVMRLDSAGNVLREEQTATYIDL